MARKKGGLRRPFLPPRGVEDGVSGFYSVPGLGDKRQIILDFRPIALAEEEARGEWESFADNRLLQLIQVIARELKLTTLNEASSPPFSR